MIKKISILVLAGMIALPAVAAAGVSATDLERKIDALTQELQELKRQMSELKAAPARETVSPREVQQLQGDMAQLKSETGSALADMKERAAGWDEAARFKLFGDFRTRLDWVTADTADHYSAFFFDKTAGANSGVAVAVADVLDAGAAFPTLLGGFGLDTTTPLTTLLGSLPPTSAEFITAAVAATAASDTPVTTKQATDLAAIFYNGAVQANLGNMIAADPATTVGAVAGAFSNAQALVSFMKQIPAADRKAIMAALSGNFVPTSATRYDNDTLLTNRLRLNMRVKAMEDLEFKGRLAMYKAWGMENNPVDYTLMGGPFLLSSLSMDGNRSRIPTDNNLLVDRAILNWNNVGGQPVWFSVGRRPTTDGVPNHLRLGLDERQATPAGYMDYAFDGFTLGYAYAKPWSGRIRFCYGRGFESGPTEGGGGLKDVDFGGISWDVYQAGNRFFYFQSFGAFDMFNVPDDVTFPNPIEFALQQSGQIEYNPLDPNANLILDRANLGNIYHTSAVYMDKWQNLNYFLNLGWSRTDPSGVDELGNGLLSSFWNTPEDQDGYAVYAGIRYDYPVPRLKVGLEYNYGSQYWIAFTPGHDDLYQSKLAARGHVVEGYLIWDIPAGEAISKYAKAFMRLGYQHYKYNYTGSGFWLGEPIDIDDAAQDPLNAQFYPPIDNMDQVYLTFEAYF